MTTTTTPTFTLRTPAQIVEQLQATRDSDFLGFTAEVLVRYLTFEQAKPLLKPDAEKGDWDDDIAPLDRESILAEMRKYMDFAWGKVSGHRGISAGRNVEKMAAWLWVLGDDEAVERIEEVSYAQYGAPKLAYVCERYGFEIPDEEGLRNMIAGDPCEPGCENGCGQ